MDALLSNLSASLRGPLEMIESLRSPLVDQYTDILKEQFHSQTSWQVLRDKALSVPVFPWIFVAHCIFVAVRVRPVLRGQHWLFSLFATFLACVGGGTIASVLLATPPPWLDHNLMFPTAAVVWYLVNHAPLPYDLFYRLAFFPPINAIIAALECVNRTRAIYVGVDKSLALFPTSMFAAIFIGTIYGFGGSLVVNATEKMIRGWDTAAKSELSAPAWGIRAAFYSTLAYILLADPFRVVFAAAKPPYDPLDVKFTILLLAVAQGVLTELFRWRWVGGPFGPFESLLLAVLRINGNTSSGSGGGRSAADKPNAVHAGPAAVLVKDEPTYSQVQSKAVQRKSGKTGSKDKGF